MMKTATVQETIRDYDFTMAQEVLNEYAAGVWADYVRYCNAHEIDLKDLEQPMAVKTQQVYEYKNKIIGTGECKCKEDLESIKEELQKLKNYLIQIKEQE